MEKCALLEATEDDGKEEEMDDEVFDSNIKMVKQKTDELEQSKKMIDEMLQETREYIDMRKQYLEELVHHNKK